MEQQGSGFGLDFRIEGSVDSVLRQWVRAAPDAAMAAADVVSDWGKREFRRPIDAALSRRVANSIRSRVFPNRGGAASLSPTISWWTNAPHILNAFTRANDFTATGKKWLAIPTENAPKAARIVGYSGRIRRGRTWLIEETEKRFGKLKLVPVRPGLALLITDPKEPLRKRAKNHGYMRASPTAIRRQNFETGVVMFILVPRARSPKLYDLDVIESRIASGAGARFAQEFVELANRLYGHQD